MVSFYWWGSTASRLLTHYEEAVYYLYFIFKFPEISGTHSIRVTWPQQPYHCPASGNDPNINQWNILSIIDKIGKKCSPNDDHFIFSADLTRLTKMFSLSCIYLQILNMYADITASYRPFSLYFFFHKQCALGKHKFYF